MNEELKQEDVNNPGNANAPVGRTVALYDLIIVVVVALVAIVFSSHYWYNRGYQAGVLKMAEIQEPCGRDRCMSYIIDTERRCEVWQKH